MKFISVALFLLLPFLSSAQFGNESPIPYFRYSVTAGVGVNQLYGDLEKRPIGVARLIRGDYFITHGFSVALELQDGLLLGQDESAINETVRTTRNLYHSVILGVRFQPLKYMQDDHIRRSEYRHSYGKRVLSSVYGGAGFGVIYNLQWDRDRPVDTGTGTVTDPYHQGSNYGWGYLFSTNIGFELPLHSLNPNLVDSYVWSIVVNGQANFAFDDHVDRYSGKYPENNSNDVFGVLNLGVNLRF